MVFPRFGNPRRILRVLPQASRFLANLWLPAPRRSTQENLLQKCAEAHPRHRPKGLPGLGFRLQLLLFFLRRISRLYKEPSNAPLTPSSQSALIKVLFLGAGAVAIPAVVRRRCNVFDCDWIVGNPEVGNRDVVFEKSVEEIVVRKLTLCGEDYRGVRQSPMLFILCMKRSERSHLRRRENVSQLRSPRSERAQRTKWLRHS